MRLRCNLSSHLTLKFLAQLSNILDQTKYSDQTKDSGTGVFLWILRNFEEHLFTEHLQWGCFCTFLLVNIPIRTYIIFLDMFIYVITGNILITKQNMSTTIFCWLSVALSWLILENKPWKCCWKSAEDIQIWKNLIVTST